MSMLQPFLSGSTTPSFPLKRTVLVCCAPSQQSHVAVANGPVLDARVPERTDIRIGLPSKGRMTSDTLDLLKVRIASFFFFSSLFGSEKIALHWISYNFCFCFVLFCFFFFCVKRIVNWRWSKRIRDNMLPKFLRYVKEFRSLSWIVFVLNICHDLFNMEYIVANI